MSDFQKNIRLAELCENIHDTQVHSEEFLTSKKFLKFVTQMKKEIKNVMLTFQESDDIFEILSTNERWSLQAFIKQELYKHYIISETKRLFKTGAFNNISLAMKVVSNYCTGSTVELVNSLLLRRCEEYENEDEYQSSLEVIVLMYLFENKTYGKYKYSYDELIEYIFKQMCRKMIFEKRYNISNLMESFKTMKVDDYLGVIRDVYIATCQEMDHLILAEQDLMSKQNDSMGDAISKNVQSLSEQSETSKREEALAQHIERLKAQLSQKDELLKAAQKRTDDAIKKAEKDSYNELAQLKKNIKLLKEENIQLQNNYAELAEYTNSLEATDAENDEFFDLANVPASIKDARLVFVCDKSTEHYVISNSVQEFFPNARFLASAVPTINLQATDLVVMLTKYIRHSTFFKVKASCKNSNVPVISCPYSGLNAIVRCIMETGKLS